MNRPLVFELSVFAGMLAASIYRSRVRRIEQRRSLERAEKTRWEDEGGALPQTQGTHL